MKVVVCISYVPDFNNELIISSDKKSIISENLNFILNPFDEFAIEEAVKLKENFNAETFAVTFGIERAKEAIRKAYSYGIDKGVLILTESQDFDSYTVARNLSEFIKEIKPDLIFFGKQSIDFDGNSVHGMVSELSGIPSINVVTKINYDENNVSVEREVENGKEILSLKLPVIIGCQKGLNTPRYPKLKDVLSSKNKPIEIKNPYYTGNKINLSELNYSEVKSGGKILKYENSSIFELIRFLKEKVKIF